MRPPGRVSSAALPWQRRRRRRRARFHRLGGLNTDESACPVLILHRCALWWWPFALSAALGRRTTAASRGPGGSGGLPRPASCGGGSLWWVDRSGSVGSWSLRAWGLLRLVRRSGRDWNEHVVMAMVAPIEVGAGGSVPDFNLGIVRSVNTDGVMVTSREHACVLLVSPFTVCA